MKLIATYGLFALIAIIANIVTQDFIMRFGGDLVIWPSVMGGTFIGICIKYFLDKRYIFRFQTTHIRQDIRSFVLYSSMGLLTTGIFWGFELTFHYLFKTKVMWYLGGFLGLAIGYVIKYYLDKQYSFGTKTV